MQLSDENKDAREDTPDGGENKTVQPDANSGVKAENKGGKKASGKFSLDEQQALKNFNDRTVRAPKKKKYGWIGNVLLLAVIALSIWMMFEIIHGNSDEITSLGDILAASDLSYAVYSLLVIAVIMLCDCLKYAVVLRTTTGKFNVKTSVKVAFLGKFYDNITPFAAGGQPMQIYYLHKKGFSGGVSSAVILIKYFAQMCCWVLTSLLFMACCTSRLDILEPAKKTLLLAAGWVGIAVNMILPLAVILFAVLPKFAQGTANGLITLGHKLKIVKDKQKTKKKAEGVINDFRSAFVIMANHPLQFIALILLCLTDVLLSFSFPFFAMKTFSGLQGAGFSELISVMAINIFVTQSVAVIPTPGNTGAMEGLGALAFKSFVGGTVLFWSMFTWRFGVYYIYLVIGLCITVFEVIRKLVISKKQKKEENL